MQRLLAMPNRSVIAVCCFVVAVRSSVLSQFVLEAHQLAFDICIIIGRWSFWTKLRCIDNTPRAASLGRVGQPQKMLESEIDQRMPTS